MFLFLLVLCSFPFQYQNLLEAVCRKLSIPEQDPYTNRSLENTNRVDRVHVMKERDQVGRDKETTSSSSPLCSAITSSFTSIPPSSLSRKILNMLWFLKVDPESQPGPPLLHQLRKLLTLQPLDQLLSSILWTLNRYDDTRVPQNTYPVCTEHCQWTVLYREISTVNVNATCSLSLRIFYHSYHYYLSH